MNICHHLFARLNLEPNALQPCCNTRNLKKLPMFAFAGGCIDMTAYTEHIRQSIFAMQKDMCSGCPELRVLDMPLEKDFNVNIKFKSISINAHRRYCNCKCNYCSFWHGNDPGYSVLPALQSLVNQGAVDTRCLFDWGGGEPSILKEFPEACMWLMSKSYQQFVFTNAIKYSPQIAKMLSHGAGMICISLDSGTRETYRAIKGIDAFRAVIKNIETYRSHAKSPFAVQLKYIIYDDNNSYEEIAAFFELCLKYGIVNVQYSVNFREANAKCIAVQTLKAAAFFRRAADECGFLCEPFFVDAKTQEYIQAFLNLTVARDVMAARDAKRGLPGIEGVRREILSPRAG